MSARLSLITLLALLLVAGLGCGEKPEVAYERLVFNARTGNEAAFLDGFTKDSRRIIEAVLALRRANGDLVDPRADPYLSIVLEQVVSATVEEQDVQVEGSIDKVKRPVATLVVTDGKINRTLRMVQLDEGWKLDALDLQSLWNDPKAFSRKEE